MKTFKLYALAAGLAFTTAVSAQISTPRPSPTTENTQTIGLTDVTVKYSRPGMKGRTIFGDLVPYNALWRTGANMATVITFGDDVTVNGSDVKAGSYALFTIPGEEEWTVILNSNTEQGGTGSYDEELDVLRFTAKPKQIDNTVESFTIDFSTFTNKGAMMYFAWENTMVEFEIGVDSDTKVMAAIKAEMAKEEVNNFSYYSAASYYYETERDINQALTWINKYEIKDGQFWAMHMKAKILAKAGKAKEAKKMAEQSMASAEEAGNANYIEMNKELLAKLAKK